VKNLVICETFRDGHNGPINDDSDRIVTTKESPRHEGEGDQGQQPLSRCHVFHVASGQMPWMAAMHLTIHSGWNR